LVAALVQEEFIPTLSNPFASLTVFAPTNEAFDNLASSLGTDINGILALPNLTEVLTYHVLGTEVLSSQLVAGPVNTLNGSPVTIGLDNGVTVNNANVTIPDVAAYNGVVHVIDAVLVPLGTDVNSSLEKVISIFPNPVQDVLRVQGDVISYMIIDQQGRKVQSATMLSDNTIDFSHLNTGIYYLQLNVVSGVSNHKVVKY